MNIKSCLLITALLTSFCTARATTAFTDITVGGIPLINTHGMNIGSETSVTGSTSMANCYIMGGSNTIANTTTNTGLDSDLIYGNTNILTNGNLSQIYGLNNKTTTTNQLSILGFGNNVTNTNFSLIGGCNNTIAGTLNDYFSLMGYSNQASNILSGAVIGNSNVILADSTGAQNIFVLGSGLTASPTTSFNGAVLVGFNNTALPMVGVASPNPNDTAPLLIVGNGVTAAAPSNALVMQQNGRTVITNRNYIAPTTATPVPVEPETLVVNGGATLNGTVTMSQRQGDIWMGSFGNAADAGPSN